MGRQRLFVKERGITKPTPRVQRNEFGVSPYKIRGRLAFAVLLYWLLFQKNPPVLSLVTKGTTARVVDNATSVFDPKPQFVYSCHFYVFGRSRSFRPEYGKLDDEYGQTYRARLKPAYLRPDPNHQRGVRVLDKRAKTRPERINAWLSLVSLEPRKRTEYIALYQN